MMKGILKRMAILGGILMLCMPQVFTQDYSAINIEEIPFSRYGSYTAFSVEYDSIEDNYKLFMRDVSGKYAWEPDEIFKLEILRDGQAEAFTHFQTTPWKLTAYTASAKMEVVYEDYRTVRFRTGDNNAVLLTKVMVDGRGWEWHIPMNEKQYRIQGGFDQYVLTSLEGKSKVIVGERIRNREVEGEIWTQFEIQPSTSSQICEFSLEKYWDGYLPKDVARPSFESCAETVKADFLKFESLYPKVRQEDQQSRFIASYVNWSCVVEPRGNIRRNGMLMSKALMRHIWSWDHCFNALALSYHNPEEAWNQFMVVLDAQQESGALTDYINDHHAQIAFVKPPVHGLTLKSMMERNPAGFGLDKLEEAYGPLTKWTNYWFTYLDDDGDGIPQYNHGCNSGWDNSTIWDIGFAVEAPDLSAFLVIQMEVLADVATKLGLPGEAADWKKRSGILLSQIISEMWNGDRFVYARSDDGKEFEESQALIYYLPMILGERLPKEIRTKLIKDLKASGLITDYGPATENPSSPFYERDGYWRGPIWAPSTYLITEGVRTCGDEEFAKEIAARFIKTCNKSGFRENFVATTGEGLRDLGYTWTSSVFLVMAHDYLYQK